MACFTCQLGDDIKWLPWKLHQVSLSCCLCNHWLQYGCGQSLGKVTRNNPSYSCGQFVGVALSNSGRVGREISPPQGSPPAVFTSFKSDQRERETIIMVNLIHEHIFDELDENITCFFLFTFTNKCYVLEFDQVFLVTGWADDIIRISW